MASYIYHCDNCGEDLIHQKPMADPHPTRCPICGKETLRHVFQPVSILYRASGFTKKADNNPTPEFYDDHAGDREWAYYTERMEDGREPKTFYPPVEGNNGKEKKKD